MAGQVGHPRSTIWAVLARHGISRRRRGQRQTFKRYEWAQPGALLHVKRLARCETPGHWATGGQRSEQLRNRGGGWAYLHVVIDDHSRFLYAEQHDREDADTVRTLQDEWAYAHRWNSSHQRTRALRSFVRYYNRRRPHSGLNDRPPSSRVHNLPDQDT